MISVPLKGSELIDCARANAKQNIEIVAHRCGYGRNTEAFDRELKKAYHKIGIQINGFFHVTNRVRKKQPVSI